MGTENSPKVAILRRGGPLASQHCFALLCSLERGFCLTLLTMWRIVGRGRWKRMVPDGIVVQVHTCR